MDKLKVGAVLDGRYKVTDSTERLSTRAGRRAVVVLTDGRDTASAKHNRDSAVAAANGLNIPVFVVGLDSSQFTPDVIEHMATATGAGSTCLPPRRTSWMRCIKRSADPRVHSQRQNLIPSARSATNQIPITARSSHSGFRPGAPTMSCPRASVR